MGIGIHSPLMWSMYADVADYHTEYFFEPQLQVSSLRYDESKVWYSYFRFSHRPLPSWAGANMITDKMGNTMIDPASVTDSVLTMVWSLFLTLPSHHRIPADGACLGSSYPQIKLVFNNQ